MVFWGLVALCVSCQPPQSPSAPHATPWFPTESAGAPRAEPSSAPQADAGEAQEVIDPDEEQVHEADEIVSPDSPCEDPEPPRPLCGSDLLRPQVPLAYNPRTTLPPAPIRAELDRIARAMQSEPSWQMLRVEVYATQDPGTDEVAKSRALIDTQARADAIFAYLYHRRRVSAERLDAVGYGYSPHVQPSSPAERYTVLLRLVHRTR